jgi:hypothetical protein
MKAVGNRRGSGICVDPSFRQIDDKLLGVAGCFESIRQTADCMGMAPAIFFPTDFRSRAPGFVTLVQGGIGDNESVVVKKVCHSRDSSGSINT